MKTEILKSYFEQTLLPGVKKKVLAWTNLLPTCLISSWVLSWPEVFYLTADSTQRWLVVTQLATNDHLSILK